MFDLEKAIAAWRRTLEHTPSLLADDVDELEQHLRDQVQSLIAGGLTSEEAFGRALREMGDYGSTEVEYRKVFWGKLRHRHQLTTEITWRFSMLKNYLKVAFRSLLRRKGYAFINVAGLAVGLACCLLIGLYVHHERSYDRFHTKADRIYRIVSEWETPGERRQLLSPGALAPALEADFPEVLDAVRVAPARHLLSHQDRRFQEDGLLYADSTLLEVFDFPLLSGDAQTALAAPDQIVLTESTARKYFGMENPIGKDLQIDGVRTLTVAGVVADVPSNSHIQFDGLISMATYEARQAWRFRSFVSGVNFSTYLLLPDGYDPVQLEAKLPGFVERHTKQAFEVAGIAENKLTYRLEPLTSIYFRPLREGDVRPAGNARNLYLFSWIGLSILLIACVNFMNLATARSVERAKEVGVRKVVGAHRKGLVGQFLLESTLLVGFAMVLAVVLAVGALPAFRSLAGWELSADRFASPFFVLGLGAVLLVVGLLAGSYPAFILSSIRPALVLKGAPASSRRGVWVRKGLVVFQFGVSVALIAGTAVVVAQLDYLRRHELGFHREQMLVIDFHADPLVWGNVESIKREMASHPAVVGGTASGYVPNGLYDTFGRQMQTGSGEQRNVSFKTYEVDYDFLPLYEIDLVAGRNFSPEFPNDSTRALIVNEAAVKHLGYTSPQDIIGATWSFGPDGPPGSIVGVVEDFHYQSLHGPVEPLALQFLRFQVRYLTLRLNTERMAETVAELEKAWERVAPHRPFDYRFLDETFDAQYRADERFGQLFGTFAGLAILIACLGLFGLAAFTVQQRTKEIGVRKVLGASVPGLVALLSKEFLRLVVIAFAIAVPVAYFGMQRWLEGFAYRTEIGAGIFILTGTLVLLIALLTVSYQSIKAALADPVKSLRYE